MTVETTSIVNPNCFAKTVTAAGTAEALKTTPTLCNGFLVVAKSTNTNPIFIGDSSVDKTTLPVNQLSAGGSISFDAPKGYRFDLSTWYMDVTTNGEGAWITYYTN